MGYLPSIDEISQLIVQSEYETAKQRIMQLEQDDIEIYSYSRIHLADLYGDMLEFQKVLDVAEELLEIAQEPGLEDHIALTTKIAAITYKAFAMYRMEQADEGFHLLITAHKNLDLDTLYRSVLEYDANLLHSRFYMIKHLSTFFQCSGIFGQGRGDYDFYIQNFEKSLQLNKLIDNKGSIANDLYSLGIVYFNHKGDPSSAINYHQQSLDIRKKIGGEDKMRASYNELCRIYDYIGDFEKALDYNQKTLEIARSMNDHRALAKCYGDAGIIFYKMGENYQALEYFKEHIKYFGMAEKPYASAEVYLYLILMENESRQKGQKNDELVSAINTVHENIHKFLKTKLSQYLRNYFNYVIPLTQAIQLKEKKRSIQRSKAQVILQELLDQPIVDIELTQLAILHLAEILLDEFAHFQEEEILLETDQLISTYYSSAQKHNAYTLMIDALLLQCKLSLIRGDIAKSHDILDRAEDIANQRDLDKWRIRVEEQKELLISEMSKWKELVDRSAPFQERLEMANLQEYILKMQQLRKRHRES